MAEGQENTQGGLYIPPSLTLPASPVHGLCVVLPPLTITTLTPQLQVHSHQEVFLSKPFFSASSPHGYIWFLQHNFVYIASGRGGDSWAFFLLYEAIFWCIFCTGKLL